MIQLDLHPDIRKLRQFGWVGLPGFAAFAAMSWFKFANPTAAMVFGVLALLVPLIGLVAPKFLRIPYVVLTVLAYPVGFVVSHLVLGLIFYGIFTPLGLWFRLLKRDPLKRSMTPDEESYWEERPPARPARDYYRQF